jgi:RNA polymerase sigma-70 factor, ECF subfamily
VTDVREAITRAHHVEWARVVVASLTRRFGDLDIAEGAAADAFATAVERWSPTAYLPNPGAWLTTTANREAIDRLGRENQRADLVLPIVILLVDQHPLWSLSTRSGTVHAYLVGFDRQTARSATRLALASETTR